METRLRQEIIQLHAHICGGLADPTRILLLYLLADSPRNVSELVTEVGLPQPTVSRHLKVLRERNLVHAERQGQSVVYHLNDERVIQALDLLRAVMADTLAARASLIETIMQDEGDKR